MKILDEMMNKRAELQIAPLIDVVFLLLIYFMVTTMLVDREADLSFTLPAPSEEASDSEPIEVVIEIGEPLVDPSTSEPNPHSGEILLWGTPYGTEGGIEELITALGEQKSLAESSSAQFIVNIMPRNNAMHGRIVEVMGACAAVGAKNVSFSLDPTDEG